MQPEGSLQCSQVPATGSYSQPDASSPQLPTLLFKVRNYLPTYLPT